MGEKYPISKEFSLLALMRAPLNPTAIRASQRIMGTPGYLGRDPELDVRTLSVSGYEGAPLDCLRIAPKGIETPAPCLVYFHGGGFVFEAAPYQYRLAVAYAKQARCVLMMPRYRLAPDHPFPVPQEDCYAVLAWVFDHAEELGIDPSRVGLVGDSAGGTLVSATSLMLRDRRPDKKPLFQMLIYPWLDARNNSESSLRFTDVPVWNSTMSKKVIPIIDPKPEATPLAYRSPAEAGQFQGLPPAYIEVAEFDSLRDDGALYAELLEEQGIPAEFHEVKGAVHGFELVMRAPTTQRMLQTRTEFMKRMFNS